MLWQDSNHRGEKGRVEIGGVPALSAGAYTSILLMVNRVKGGGAHHPPSPSWAEFTILIECTPESSHWQSSCTLSSVILTVYVLERTLDQSEKVRVQYVLCSSVFFVSNSAPIWEPIRNFNPAKCSLMSQNFLTVTGFCNGFWAGLADLSLTMFNKENWRGGGRARISKLLESQETSSYRMCRIHYTQDTKWLRGGGGALVVQMISSCLACT